MDLAKPQVLRCIIHKFEQASNDASAQRSTLCKGLINYNKVNGITPTTIHVQIAHPRLFEQRKQQLGEKVAEPVAPVRQLGTKITTPSAFGITSFFGATYPYRKIDKQQQQFLEDLVLPIVVKKTMDHHVLPNLALAIVVPPSFNLWMSHGGVDTFAFLINVLSDNRVPMHNTSGLFEVNETKLDSG